MNRTSKAHTVGQRERREEVMGSWGATDLELVMVLRSGAANVGTTVRTPARALQKVGNGMRGDGPWRKTFPRLVRMKSTVQRMNWRKNGLLVKSCLISVPTPHAQLGHFASTRNSTCVFALHTLCQHCMRDLLLVRWMCRFRMWCNRVNIACGSHGVPHAATAHPCVGLPRADGTLLVSCTACCVLHAACHHYTFDLSLRLPLMRYLSRSCTSA